MLETINNHVSRAAASGRSPRPRTFPCLGTVAVLLLGLGGCGKPGPPGRQPLRIMPVGDSITQGTRENGSYRRELWRQLKDAGIPADFVGSQQRYDLNRRQEFRMDADHEGYSRLRADEVAARLRVTAGAHPADIALVHVGTNDTTMPRSTEQIITSLSGIIEALRTANPKVKILLARLIPIANPTLQARIDELNPAIDELAATLTTHASPILVIDQASDFTTEDDTVDGLHPNRKGAIKMARRWFDGIQRVTSVN